MILFTIVVALFVAIFMIGPFVVSPAMAVFCLVAFILQMKDYQKLDKVKTTPMICHLCGSRNVEIKSIDKNMASFLASYKHKKIYQIEETGDVLTETLFCKDCNMDSRFISQYKLDSVKGDKKGMAVVWAIGFISSCFMGFYFWGRVLQK